MRIGQRFSVDVYVVLVDQVAACLKGKKNQRGL
jgi:hypothetical protein